MTAPAEPAQVLLDANLLLGDPACTGGYVDLGVREVSPDGLLLASTRWTSPATSCSSSASVTWPPAKTSPTASMPPTTGLPGRRMTAPAFSDVLNYVNASAGVDVSGWTVSLIAKNITNENGVLYPELAGTTNPVRPEPRTIGASVSTTF